MKRETWKADLRSYLTAQADAPFAYGSADCGAFAGGAIEAMTGENPHAAVAGKYKTMAGALRALKRLGHEDHIAYAASVLDEIDPLYAQLGDIAVVQADEGHALGVVVGAHIEVRTPAGRGVVPLTDAVRAFRVRETVSASGLVRVSAPKPPAIARGSRRKRSIG